ncbi:SusC/RagA family TonB-linked outer membrane protein [Rhodohalobacter sulfatireducens]|uniref:TonB-dependent receptor n=1 Tax=Rhodohalobacter sulfatireducens TaxID=2911366 RepID=A0ABS9KJB8_9BACT|nr:TonB-dependent receptor [Rhodohalobacter sulfatireducens]MCG2590933.1 TonB-dependent receptor [Rhodohalobacter sulfatireducens]
MKTSTYMNAQHYKDGWKRLQRSLVILLMGITVFLTGNYSAEAQSSNYPVNEKTFAQMVSSQENSDSNLLSIQFTNVTLQEALELLAKEINVGFSFNPDVIPDKKVTFSLSNVPPHEVIYKLLEDTNLEPILPPSKDVIVIREKEQFEADEIFIQNISGRVTDAETGEVLPGVNVIVANAEESTGSTIGTTTNMDGEYEVQVPDELNTLVFSYIGYQRTEVQIDGRTEIDVELSSDVQLLEDIVVIGYGTQRRQDLTGSVSSISTEELNNQATTSFDTAMQGKIAGVRVVQSNGAPGGRTRVRIRGQNSVLGGSDPLYVIDGVPIISGSQGNTNELSAINPQDIESIDVLKDASATAIYGARGSNGVILITTKQGTAGEQRVDFETSFTISEVENKLELLNAEEFVEIANDRARNDGVNEPFPNPSAVTGTDVDWMDEIFRTAYKQNYSLSTSGGDENTRYAVSTNFTDEEGVIIGSDFRRGAFRVNLTQDVTDNFRVTPTLYVSRTKSSRINTEEGGDGSNIILNTFMAPPIQTPYDEEGNITPGTVLKQYPFSPGSGDNPVGLALEQLNELSSDRVLGNLAARYELMEGLSVRVMGGIDNASNKIDLYTSRVLQAGLPAGQGSEVRNSTTTFLSENTVNYAQSLSSNHRIDATAGFTWQKEESEFVNVSASNFVTDALFNNNLSAGENFTSPNNGSSEWTLISWLGRLNYTWKDRYLFTVTGRVDGSSRFGEGNKYGTFPSGAFAWRISEESFMENVNQVDNLKLRLSWGVSGNQAISPFQSLQRMVPQQIVLGQNSSVGFAPANLANPNLKWEKTEQIDAGIDFEAWNQRIRVNADYYYKNTSDLLALVNLPPSSGFSSILQNVGSVVNKGFELQVGADILRREFSWNVSANISTNKNEVQELARGADIIAPDVNIQGPANIIREGEPLGAFFGLKQDGLTEDGLFNYVDQNGDGQINNDDRVIIGSPYPDFSYGISMNFNYKGFSLNTLLQGEVGKEVYNSNKERGGVSMHRGYNSIKGVVNRWTQENPDPNAPFPKATSNLNANPSSFFVEDGSFFRLKNVRLAYSIPVTSINLPMRSATVYMSGQNLFTITDYTWFTPDVNSYSSNDLRIGVDRGSYPNNRSITFGVNIGF